MNYLRVNLFDRSAIKEMSELASRIVKEHYDPILGAEQNDYMIEKFQSVPAITAQLHQGYSYYFVLDENKNKVGFIAFYTTEEYLYLSKFYLEKTQRGKGVSKDMLSFVANKAKEAGLSSIVLNVNKYNSAVLVYEKLGFRRIREEKNDIGNGYFMDDYVYEYLLTLK